MHISMLHKMSRANNFELKSIAIGTSRRTCHRFSKESTTWLIANGSLHTAKEISEQLGHNPRTIRAKARHLGIKLKQGR